MRIADLDFDELTIPKDSSLSRERLPLATFSAPPVAIQHRVNCPLNRFPLQHDLASGACNKERGFRNVIGRNDFASNASIKGTSKDQNQKQSGKKSSH